MVICIQPIKSAILKSQMTMSELFSVYSACQYRQKRFERLFQKKEAGTSYRNDSWYAFYSTSCSKQCDIYIGSSSRPVPKGENVRGYGVKNTQHVPLATKILTQRKRKLTKLTREKTILLYKLVRKILMLHLKVVRVYYIYRSYTILYRGSGYTSFENIHI